MTISNIFLIIDSICCIILLRLFIVEFRKRAKYEKIMLKIYSEMKKLTIKNDNLKAENQSLIELLDEATRPRDDGEYFHVLSDTSAQKSKYTCRSNSKEEKMRIKYQGTASMAPYQFYHRRKVRMPDWAVECTIKYRKEKQNLRKLS